jgi:hypothetical protein
MTAKVASTGSVSTASGTAMPRNDERHPDQIENGDEHPEALGAKPGEPAEQILAALLRR